MSLPVLETILGILFGLGLLCVAALRRVPRGAGDAGSERRMRERRRIERGER